MESFLKRIKIELMITAVLYILLGLAVVIWPGASSGAFAVLLENFARVSGVRAHRKLLCVRTGAFFRSGLAVGALCVCFGAAIFAKTPPSSRPFLPFVQHGGSHKRCHQRPEGGGPPARMGDGCGGSIWSWPL